MSTSTAWIEAVFTGGYSNLVTVLTATLGAAVALVMGLAALFFVIKWTIGKIQGRRK